MVSTLIAGILLGPLPVWSHVPFGSDLAAREHIVGRHARAAERAVRVIPAEAPVSATNTLGAHLSERRRVFSFPVLGEARWVAVDLEQRGRETQVRRSVAALRADGRFTVVFDEDGILVLHRER